MDWRSFFAGLMVVVTGTAFAESQQITLPPISGVTQTAAQNDANPHSEDLPKPQPVTPPTTGTIESEPVLLAVPEPQGFLPWISVQYATSPEITQQQTPYTSFQAFVPVSQWDSGLFFVNGDGFINNYGRWGSNVGGGGRWYTGSSDRILGFNAFWDNNDTSFGTYNQLGLGIESLGRYVDFRANGYIPLGDTQKVYGVTFTNPTFVNHFILLNQNTFTASALSGFDSEIGGWVPFLGDYGLRAYVGPYWYEGPSVSGFAGGHFRLEERATDNLTLNLTLDTDHTFGTTVMFSAAYRFGGASRRRGSSRGNVFSRLVDQVDRNDNIAVLDPESTVQVEATKPGTNTPIYVDHFASYAAAGGDGTFEHPFNKLQNPTIPQQADILFVWANSVFNRQSFTLLNNQRLLGEGLTYYVTASQGTFVLPRATSFSNLPVIQNSCTNGVTLANNDEVAGLVITGAGNDGIYGNGVTGFYIHDNVITHNFANGIVLENLNGTGTIANNVVSYNGPMLSGLEVAVPFGDGIYLSGTSFTGNITGNTCNNNGDVPNGASTGYYAGGEGTVAFGQGISVNVGTFTGNITGNTANNNGTVGAPSSEGTGIDNDINLTFGQGIAVNVNTFNGNINGNTTNGNGSVAALNNYQTGVSNDGTLTFGQGILVSANNFNGNINGNTANGNGAFGNLSTGSTGVSNGETVTFGQGILVSGTGCMSAFNGNINGNATSGNGAFALLADSSEGVSSGGAATFGQGIAVMNLSKFTGSINGNAANGNGSFGNITDSAEGVSTGGTTIFGQGIALISVTTVGNGSTINGNTVSNNGSFGNISDSAEGVSTGGTTTFGQGILALNGTSFTGEINGNTANSNGTFGNISGSAEGISTGGTTSFGQGILVLNQTTLNGDISGNTANGNGTFGNISGSAEGVSTGGTTTFGQGIAVGDLTTLNGNINNNTVTGNGSFGTLTGDGDGVSSGGTTTFGQGILVLDTTTVTGNINGNTANNNGNFGTISGGIDGVSAGGTTIFGQGIAVVNANTFNGNVSGNTANGNGSFGQVSNDSDGVSAGGTTIFGQGIYLQANNYNGSLANNTLMNNGTFAAENGGTNVSTGGTAIFGQGMFLQGTGGDGTTFFAFVDNNKFGGNFGTQNADNTGTVGTDLLAIYTGSNKMGVELSGNTTTNIFTEPPPFNYDLQNQGTGTFNLLNNQATTGGNGSVGTSTGTAPTAGPVPF